jgi:hypothetical protein
MHGSVILFGESLLFFGWPQIVENLVEDVRQTVDLLLTQALPSPNARRPYGREGLPDFFAPLLGKLDAKAPPVVWVGKAAR